MPTPVTTHSSHNKVLHFTSWSDRRITSDLQSSKIILHMARKYNKEGQCKNADTYLPWVPCLELPTTGADTKGGDRPPPKIVQVRGGGSTINSLGAKNRRYTYSHFKHLQNSLHVDLCRLSTLIAHSDRLLELVSLSKLPKFGDVRPLACSALEPPSLCWPAPKIIKCVYLSKNFPRGPLVSARAARSGRDICKHNTD